MIKDNQKYFNQMHVVIDAIVLIFSYVVAWILRYRTNLFGIPVRSLAFNSYMMMLLLIVPGYLLFYFWFNLYTPKRVQGRRKELVNLLKANTVGLLIIILVLYMLKQEHFARSMLFLFYGLNVLLEVIVRNIIRYILMEIRRRGFNQKHILLVGYSRSTEEYIDRILSFPEWGYTIRGILDDHAIAGTSYQGIKVMGRIENLMIILSANKLDEIAITLGLNEYYRLEEIVALCEKSGVHTKFIPDYHNIIPTKPYTEDLMGLPVINIRHVPLSNTFNAMIKRMIDIVGALLCIIFFSPVMLLAVIGIKVTSPGPLIYRQIRVGIHNRSFEMYKFRSMKIQKPEEERKAWTVKNDPRVTKFGKFMRKRSIDELPQFFNVLKGDMSLVGPRPERPFFVTKFREEIPRYMIKHQVRPGITGWAQVNGYRGDTSIRKRIDYDLYYIENCSVGLDVKILFLTVFRGFSNKNAY
ncbi:MAG: undecaprenyl-phosphate glucose phosphotransferase [Lachnospiraceae bacterium]|nr:undecaprenyl-phosphate glucose phosphotransferase [Lachnospiraceae bacterium]